jgi:hypothetical protein
MNRAFKSGGLSARRRAIDKVKKITSRVSHCIKRGTLWGFVLMTSAIISSCHEKTNGQHSADLKKEQAPASQDTLNKPKVNIKVNKRYDDKGNLVGFDSTYSSYYSNVQGDTAKMDSLMSSFDRYFNRNHSSFFDNRFNSLFFNDSQRYSDFFHRDFFLKRYESNDAFLRNMMHSMDSVKNRFYQEQQGHSKGNKKSKDL